jgi:hypothetical protein
MTNSELAKLVSEKHRLKAKLRQLTKNIQEIQDILARIDAIDQQLGM